MRDFFIRHPTVEDDGFVGRLRSVLQQGEYNLQNALYLLGFGGSSGLLLDRYA